jgi:hypothetical protein
MMTVVEAGLRAAPALATAFGAAAVFSTTRRRRRLRPWEIV